MTSTESRNLAILSAIESTESITQRQLATMLDVALGTVNHLIHDLTARGWIHRHHDNGKSSYELTSQGIAERLRLLQAHLRQKLEDYAGLRNRIAGQLEKLDPGKRRLVFYGAGNLAELCFIAAVNGGFELIGIVDDRKIGRRFFGHTIASPSVLEDGHFNGSEYDILVVTSQRHAEEIKTRVAPLNIEASRVVFVLSH